MNTMTEKKIRDLSRRFRGPLQTDEDASKRLIRALKLTTRLSTTAAAAENYELFGTIMESGIAQEMKTEAARLALHAAYQQGLEAVPPVGNPKHILDFLLHHIDLLVEREGRAHVASSVMRATGPAPNDPTSRSWTWHMENGDDGIDLKRCRVAIEGEIERVKKLDGASSILTSLDEAFTRLTALIGHW